MSEGEPPNDGKRRRVIDKGQLVGENHERQLLVKVKTARKRTVQSARWLERQLNDPYVKKARAAGYRSRAAFKLAELNQRFHFLEKGARVIDLGVAPGGWSQVALEKGASAVVGIDLLPVEPIFGVTLIEADFLAPNMAEHLIELLGGPPNLVLSDMAANTTGHRRTDHLRTSALAEAAAQFALDMLAPGGHFVTKVFQGGGENIMLGKLKLGFESVRHAKPPASRAESVELYLVAMGRKES